MRNTFGPERNCDVATTSSREGDAMVSRSSAEIGVSGSGGRAHLSGWSTLAGASAEGALIGVALGEDYLLSRVAR